MKKVTILFMMMFLLVGTLAMVSAESVNDSAIPHPEKIGFFENQMFKLGLFFTFNKEKKVDKILNMAERRLAESELLVNKSSNAYTEEQEKYDDLIARAENILSEIQANGSDNKTSIEDMNRIARIQNRFEQHVIRANELYSRALKRFEANNVSQKKIQRFEMFRERALNRSAKMEERAVERQKIAIRRYKALSHMNDEQLAKLVEKIQNNSGLIKTQKIRREQLGQRFNKLRAVENKRFGDRESYIDHAANLTKEQRQLIEARFRDQENHFRENKEGIQQRFDNMTKVREQRMEDIRNAIKKRLEAENPNLIENKSGVNDSF